MAPLAPVAVWVGAHAGTVAATMAAAGTVASAWGSIQAGRIQEGTARMNARMEAQRAVEARAQAALEEYRHRKESRRLLSRQKSLFLKAGVRMEGTPLEVIGETAAEAELDALMIRKYGYVAAREAAQKRAIYRMGGRAARGAGYIRAGTTLLTGGAELIGD